MREQERAWKNGPASFVGRVLATINNADCESASTGLVICGKAAGGFFRGGTTYGDVYITGRERKDVSQQEFRRESIHSWQWALVGPVGFPIAYGLAGGDACTNMWEQGAGLDDGGYDC